MAVASQSRSDNQWHWTTDQEIPSRLDATKPIIDSVLEAMGQCGWPQPDAFSVHLALEEALVNAIKHGNQFADDKNVHVVCSVGSQRIRIEVTDAGEGFNLDDVPDPTADDRLEVPSGRGIMLMRSFMSHVEYHDPGNRVVMEKTRDEAKE